jgi:hypothetical protein
MKPPKYTAEQVDEIIERIAILRMRWLAVVKNQLANQARDDEPERRRAQREPQRRDDSRPNHLLRRRE